MKEQQVNTQHARRSTKRTHTGELFEHWLSADLQLDEATGKRKKQLNVNSSRSMLRFSLKYQSKQKIKSIFFYWRIEIPVQHSLRFHCVFASSSFSFLVLFRNRFRFGLQSNLHVLSFLLSFRWHSFAFRRIFPMKFHIVLNALKKRCEKESTSDKTAVNKSLCLYLFGVNFWQFSRHHKLPHLKIFFPRQHHQRNHWNCSHFSRSLFNVNHFHNESPSSVVVAVVCRWNFCLNILSSVDRNSTAKILRTNS